jgi:hypothetical protein
VKALPAADGRAGGGDGRDAHTSQLARPPRRVWFGGGGGLVVQPGPKKKKNKKLATAAGIFYTCTLDALRIYASLGLWNVMRGFVDDRQPRRAAAVYLELNLIAVKTRQLSRIRVSTLVLFHQCF